MTCLSILVRKLYVFARLTLKGLLRSSFISKQSNVIFRGGLITRRSCNGLGYF